MTNSVKLLKVLGATLIIIALAMTFNNYKKIRGLLYDRYDRYQETIETSISSNLNKYQDISNMLDRLIDGRLENCTNEMLNLYQKNSDVTNWDLDQIRKKYNNLHIYIIDTDLMVINTTDKDDLGLDFKKFKVLAQILYKRLKENKLVIDDIDLSIKSGKISKYSYMSTPDNKYIFELGIDIEKELSSDLPINEIGIEMVNKLSFVDEINIYKVDKNKIPFRKVNKTKHEKFKFDVKLLDHAHQAIDNGQKTEYREYDEENNVNSIHRFIPLNVYDEYGSYDWWSSYLVEVTYNETELDAVLATEKQNTAQMMFVILVVYGGLMIAIQLLFKKSVKAKKSVEKIIETTNEGFCLLDKDLNIVNVNKSLTRMLGYEAKELVGVNIRKYIDESKLPKMMSGYRIDEVDKTKQFTLEEKIIDKSGQEIYVRIQATTLCEKELEGFFAFLHDITEEKMAEDYIKHLAYHDGLTNLPNRKYFEKTIEEQLNLEDADTEFAIMFIDLDDFKLINDNYGHDVGDELLRKVADRFTGMLSDDDMIARIGGDEFILFTSKEKAICKADVIYEKFRDSFVIHGYNIKAKLSIGIAYYPQDGHTVEDVIKKADAAMYVSKRNGKNNYIVSRNTYIG